MAGRRTDSTDLEPRPGPAPTAPVVAPPGGVREHAAADAHCIAAVLGGNREKFGELIERYQHLVITVVRGYVQDAHAAEDVAQDIFVSAFTSLHQLREPTNFLPWLLQIARHRAALTGKRRDEAPVRSASEQLDVAAPEPELEAGLRLQTVFAAVEQLPEPYRETVLLKYQQNLSCKEIAERDGVAVGTITSRLTRALLILRGALAGDSE